MPEFESAVTLPDDVDAFVRGYLETAEWCGISDARSCGGWCRNCDSDDPAERCEPSERSKYDAAYHVEWSPEAIQRAKDDCAQFWQAASADDRAAMTEDLERAGHDFYLTRNGHGAGFWDGDWSKDTGRRLTELCRTMRDEGSVLCVVGEDGNKVTLEWMG